MTIDPQSAEHLLPLLERTLKKKYANALTMPRAVNIFLKNTPTKTLVMYRDIYPSGESFNYNFVNLSHIIRKTDVIVSFIWNKSEKRRNQHLRVSCII